MKSIFVSDGLIEEVVLLDSLPFYVRLDVWPFLVSYSILFLLITSDDSALKVIFCHMTAWFILITLILFSYLDSQFVQLY